MEEETKYEVEAVGSPLESDKLIAIAEASERRMEAVKKIKRNAIRVTNEKDWVDQAGRPYLQSSGAEKIARVFGISWRFIGEPQKSFEESGHFRYEAHMEFLLAGSTIEVRGSRSSKDTFFTTRYKFNEETKKKDIKIELPPSEIDAGDVLKSAITNGIGNGITRILGIRNLDWEDLRAGGIDIDKIGKVEYKKKGETGTKTNGEHFEIKDPNSPATDKQIEAIKNIGKGLGLSFDQIKDRCFKALGRVIEEISSPSIKKGEAGKVIELLQKERKEAKGD